MKAMTDISRILDAIGQGDRKATDELLPLVYTELRRLAAHKLAREAPGQTLQPTALVHEAYLRLVGHAAAEESPQAQQQFDGRGHFFAAAAEAMRRILIDQARSKATLKRGQNIHRIDLNEIDLASTERCNDLLALDEALIELEQHDGPAAQLVKLRYFAGLTHQQAAEALGVSRRAADRLWSLARAWLYQRIREK